MRNKASVGARAYFFSMCAYVFLSLAAFLILFFETSAGSLFSAIAALNLSSFVLCGYDKRVAGTNEMRVPENVLFLSALSGGSIGLLLGMRIFRHKSRKAGFQLIVFVIVIAQVLLLKRFFS